jgi:hypothetical protein
MTVPVWYYLVVHNVGKKPEYVKVYDNSGLKRKARFRDYFSALEASRIIDVLRSDTTYIKTEVVIDAWL